MSYNRQWLCTADNNPAYMLDRTNSGNKPGMIHRLRWTNSSSGADTVFEIQTCNPSISSSRVFFDAMMYLDIGTESIVSSSPYRPKNLGSWGFHTRIFISRSTNDIARYYDVPVNPPVVAVVQKAGDVTVKSWDSPRWSNHPYFASATLFLERAWDDGTTDRNEAIYLIDLRNSSYVKLLSLADTSGSNSLSMDYPWLWVETPSDLASSEDENWLAASLDAGVKQTGGNPVGREGAALHVRHGEIVSLRPMASIEFVTLSGAVAGKIQVYGRMSCAIPRGILPGGVRLAVCTYSDNSHSILKINSVER
jgi:hypothetical protein